MIPEFLLMIEAFNENEGKLYEASNDDVPELRLYYENNLFTTAFEVEAIILRNKYLV